MDPTGGSGTTALTCSLLGIDCDTVEVNPFLADVIWAKTRSYFISDLSDEAEAEDRAAHPPAPGRLHLQPDDEREHRHAELGNVKDSASIAEQAKARRADGEPLHEAAEHQAEPA